MNNASDKGGTQRKRREMGYTISSCRGAVTEPPSLHVSCAQTMALQMNVIFVPWHSNPCSMMSLSNSRGLFERLFFLFFIIMSDMVRTVSGGCVTGVLASVHGRLTLTQWLNLGRGISGTTQTAAASYWKRAFMLIKVFLWLNRDFQGSLKRHI